MWAYIHHFWSPAYCILALNSPSPSPRAELAGRCDDYLSVRSSYLTDTPAVSPHSVKLMSCKNSINAPPQCSFLLYFLLIFSLLFTSISLSFNPIFLTSPPLLSFSFLWLSNCCLRFFFLDSSSSLLSRLTALCGFCWYALTRGSI